MDEMEGVFATVKPASPARGRGSALADDDLVVQVGPERLERTNIGHMRMSTQKEINALSFHQVDGGAGIANFSTGAAAGGVHHMVVEHKHPAAIGSGLVKRLVNRVDLLPIEIAAIYRPAVGRTPPHHRQAGPVEHRVECVGDIAVVSSERKEHPIKPVEQGDIVVAGHHKLRLREHRQVADNCLPLAGKIGPQHEITRDGHEVGAQLVGLASKLLRHAQIEMPASVQVRKV